jgi:hypothetical protein
MRRGFLLPENGKEEEVFMFNLKALPPIERKPDGTLPTMTPRQKQAAVRLIKKTCCNYDDGNCILLDRGEEVVCPQSISYSFICKFFRWILLEGKEGLPLKAEILRDDTTKRCVVCNQTFQSKSNNAKYCTECAPCIQRIQKAAHARKRRARVEK